MTSGNKHNKQSGGKIGGGVISIAIAAFFLYLAFRNVDLKQSFVLMENASLLYFLLFVFLFVFTNLIRTLRWKLILSGVKNDVSLLNIFSSMMIGYGINLIIPRLGEIYRAFFLGKWEGISRTSIFGTVIVERIIDILALFLATFISVLIYNGDIYSQIPWLKTTLVTGGAISTSLLLGVILIVLSGEKSYGFILNLVSRFSTKFSETLQGIFESLVEGFASVRGATKIISIIIYTALIMIFYGLNSLVAFYMLGIENFPGANYTTAWILMTISAFGIVIPTPGGIGSYHAIVIFVLTTLFGFSADSSAAYAILTHIISYFGFIFLAAVSLFFANKRQLKLGFPKQNFWSVLKRED